MTTTHPTPWMTRACDCAPDCPRYLIADLAGATIANCIDYGVAVRVANAVNRLASNPDVVADESEAS